MEWQPIETAPKDGTIVKVVAESTMGILRRYPYPINSIFYAGKWCWQFNEGDWTPFDPQPTHWMPLPPPPKDTP